MALEPSVKLEYTKQKWDKPSYDNGIVVLKKAVRHNRVLDYNILTSCIKFDTYYIPPTPLPPWPESTAGMNHVLLCTVIGY